MTRCKEFYDLYENNKKFCKEGCKTTKREIKHFLALKDTFASRGVPERLIFCNLTDNAVRELAKVKDGEEREALIDEIEQDLRDERKVTSDSIKLKRRRRKVEKIKANADHESGKRWNVYHEDMQLWEAPRKYDFIITDPPYEKDALPLYESLAESAHGWLKEGGVLAAMCGLLYLDQIYALMGKYIPYYWTCAYLIPGAAKNVYGRRVNQNWKAVLVYVKGEYNGRGFGDVFKSEASEKEDHDWGQSVSGMLSIVQQLCDEGQYILDPFCGAGATGIAALRHGCYFDGVELDELSYKTSIKRLNEENNI